MHSMKPNICIAAQWEVNTHDCAWLQGVTWTCWKVSRVSVAGRQCVHWASAGQSSGRKLYIRNRRCRCCWRATLGCSLTACSATVSHLSGSGQPCREACNVNVFVLAQIPVTLICKPLLMTYTFCTDHGAFICAHKLSDLRSNQDPGR